MEGRTRVGPFVIERELGRGGAGVVYAARLGERPVALKIAHAELDPRDKQHFVEEAEILARVSHPSIIEGVDHGTLEDGRPYLLMPLVAGETLAARLGRGRLPVDLALRLCAQLAGAVASLHDAGIVHRDIKPENVMIVEDEERVVLLDFGIAREIDRPASTTTRMNLVRGTPGCMAPERFFGVRAGAASDVYELGVVLYAMLVAELPWDDPTDPEARLRLRGPEERGVKLPGALAALVLEMLSTRPERRPSAREIVVRLRAIDPGGPASGAHARHRTTAPLPMGSPPPRAPEQRAPRRTVGRWRSAATAVALACVAIGASPSLRSRARGHPALARSGFSSARLLAARAQSEAEATEAKVLEAPTAEPAPIVIDSSRAPRAPSAIPPPSSGPSASLTTASSPDLLSAPIEERRARYELYRSLMPQVMAAINAHDGAKCMELVDRVEQTGVGPTGIDRGKCEMLLGRCEQGTRRLRANGLDDTKISPLRQAYCAPDTLSSVEERLTAVRQQAGRPPYSTPRCERLAGVAERALAERASPPLPAWMVTSTWSSIAFCFGNGGDCARAEKALAHFVPAASVPQVLAGGAPGCAAPR